MANQQLFDYVKAQLSQGHTKEAIKSELLRVGWQEWDVNEALGLPNAMPTPTPLTPLPPSPSTRTAFASSGLRQLDPKAVWLFFLGSSSWFTFMFIWVWLGIFGTGVEGMDSDEVMGYLFKTIAFVVVLVLVTSFVWAKLKYHFYRYELTDAGFRKELGIISKKYVTIPYDRIQNVDIYRGLLSRILGLSDLNIQTAGMSMGVGSGGGGSEGRLPALSRGVAEQLRDELIARSRQSKGQGL